MAVCLVVGAMNLASCGGNAAAEQELDEVIAYTKQSIPFTVDEISTCVDLVKEDDCVMYLYDVRDDRGAISAIAKNPYGIKQRLIAELDNPEFRSFVIVVVNSGRGIGYRYHDTITGNSAEVIITHDELQDGLRSEETQD